jgi:biotin carboxyl carrier protein
VAERRIPGRTALLAALTLEIEVDNVLRRVVVEREGAQHIIRLDGRAIPVDLCEAMPGVLSLLIGDGNGGRAYRCVRITVADEETIAVGGERHRVAISDPRSLRGQRKRTGAGNGTVQIKASMPGRIARVLASPGDQVMAHQGVVVIEAMKMQNELKAPRDGRVAEVRVAAGDTVASGQVLAVLE